jgi:hypothetical protein
MQDMEIEGGGIQKESMRRRCKTQKTGGIERMRMLRKKGRSLKIVCWELQKMYVEVLKVFQDKRILVVKRWVQ